MTAPRTIDSLILFGLRGISGIAIARDPHLNLPYTQIRGVSVESIN